MRFWFCIVGVFAWATSFAQAKFLSLADTNYVSNSYITDSTDFVSFYNDSRLLEEFNPLDPDIELLNAGIIAAIQNERKKRKMKLLEFSEMQYTLCKNFVDYYLPSQFNADDERLAQFTTTSKKALRKMQFPKGINKVFTNVFRAVNHKKNSFYYLSSDNSTDLKLFEGVKPAGLDSVELAELNKKPIQLYTYRSFIDDLMKNLIKKKYKSVLYSKDYSSLACYIKVDPRSLNRQKLPQVALILMFGADRLKDMNVAETRSKNQKKLIK